MKVRHFKRTPLAIALACVSTVSYVHAEASAADTEGYIEEVRVLGIRSSINESLSIKEQAVGVVDVIVADDIGKFPDENLAEALQRVPGVTISRNNGEGQKISVRGLSGRYNVTTLNGRKLASESTARDFNFDTIASELVGALSVHKSPEARLTDGGIGSVVNIETRKPLNMEDTTIAGSVKGIYESRSEETNPQASLILGSKNADESLGVLFSVTYSNKTLRSDTFEGSHFYQEDQPFGLSNNDERFPNKYGLAADLDQNGLYDENEIFASDIPTYMYLANAQDERERLGGTLAFQWRPVDDLELSADLLYSRYNTDGKKSKIGFSSYGASWRPGPPEITQFHQNSDGRVDLIEQSGDNSILEYINQTTPRKTDTYQLGLQGTWHVNDALTLVADAAYSEAKNKNKGDNAFIVTRSFGNTILFDHRQGNKLPDVSVTPGNTTGDRYGAHYSRLNGTDVTSKVTDIKLAAEYSPVDDWFTRVETGINYVKQDKQQDAYSSSNPSQFSFWSSGTDQLVLDRDGFTYDKDHAFSIGNLYQLSLPADIFNSADFDNFMDGENSLTPNPWPSVDAGKLIDYYRSVNAEAANNILPSFRPGSSYGIEEEIINLYIQGDIEQEIAGLPYTLNLGLKVSRTELTSTGNSQDLLAINLDANGQPLNDDWKAVTQVEFSNDYTDVLPSVNFKLYLQDDLLLRASAAKVLSRPNLYDMRAMASEPTFNSQDVKISRGNPNLKPEKANQADLALEWYFGDSSAATVGVFVKDVTSYIYQQSNVPVTIGKVDYLSNQPQNNDDGVTLSGMEFGWQQSLDAWLPENLSGFGFQLNYTYVDADYDAENAPPLDGMSENSYNAVFYYEQHGFQARIAYNWRDEYKSQESGTDGAIWISDYGQLDASASYQINDTVTAFIEASNLTNERYWGYAEVENQVNYLERFGTQISLGLRAQF
ncbi:TonB-dependent receptor [Bowmanella pacifica]|uniref:TonB-dependent receptor n=1 Tax=Bowmanella pacifica TaxID=502051 RepID=A0A917Z6Y1_9ALTE|nr:TonB-dependent receptor [Bowmanella pacifica]GGO74553.1 hypothetical protein GCM10010982_37640 [Bowmanella pacifica]